MTEEELDALAKAAFQRFVGFAEENDIPVTVESATKYAKIAAKGAAQNAFFNETNPFIEQPEQSAEPQKPWYKFWS